MSTPSAPLYDLSSATDALPPSAFDLPSLVESEPSQSHDISCSPCRHPALSGAAVPCAVRQRRVFRIVRRSLDVVYARAAIRVGKFVLGRRVRGYLGSVPPRSCFLRRRRRTSPLRSNRRSCRSCSGTLKPRGGCRRSLHECTTKEDGAFFGPVAIYLYHYSHLMSFHLHSPCISRPLHCYRVIICIIMFCPCRSACTLLSL